MAVVNTDKAEERALAFLVGKSGYTVRLLNLKLFTNDITPAEADVVGAYTEATFTGYAAAVMASADWTISGTTPTAAVAAQKTFASTAAQALQNVYGWYMTTATDNELVQAFRFTDAPRPIQNDGDQILVIVRLTAANG
jgi:hypothetical protein